MNDDGISVAHAVLREAEPPAFAGTVWEASMHMDAVFVPDGVRIRLRALGAKRVLRHVTRRGKYELALYRGPTLLWTVPMRFMQDVSVGDFLNADFTISWWPDGTTVTLGGA